MNTVSRPDGVKEKRAEFTLSRLHPSGAGPSGTPMTAESGGMAPPAPAPVVRRASSTGSVSRPGAVAPTPASPAGKPAEAAAPVWNTSPLVADPEGLDEEDDIPF
jgi:hypothetical protein